MKHRSYKSDVRKHFRQASRFASKEVERLARKILREHPCLKEFVMGMGSACFSLRNGGAVSVTSNSASRAYTRPLDDFIAEWDRYLKITGEPMRFTATGKIVRNW